MDFPNPIFTTDSVQALDSAASDAAPSPPGCAARAPLPIASWAAAPCSPAFSTATPNRRPQRPHRRLDAQAQPPGDYNTVNHNNNLHK